MLKPLAALTVLVSVFAQGAIAHAAWSPVRASLDKEIPRLLAANAIPSVSIAQIRRRRLVLTAAYGFQSAGVPAATATLYNIASLTKPLTAEIVLRLASDGAFSLDEPMYRYWTDPDIADDDWRTELTPRIALSHQTGFPNWRDRKQGLKFLSKPGTKYGYSGEGYEYLARFVEKRTGRNFEDLAETYLFGPTGMRDTAFTEKPWFKGRIAVPTDASGQPLKPIIAAHYSAADLVYTTPRDYAAFMIDVLNNRRLTAAIAEERSRPQVSMMDAKCEGAKALTCPQFTGFGLGWQILFFKNATLMMHTGRDDGVFTFAYLDRSAGDGVVIFTNSDNGDKLVIPILERLGANAAFIRYLQDQM